MMDGFHIYQIAEYFFHMRMPVSTSKWYVYSYVSTLCDSISSYKHKIDFIYIYCDILCTSEHLAVMEPYCYKTKNKQSLVIVYDKFVFHLVSLCDQL